MHGKIETMKYPPSHAWNQHLEELNRRRPSLGLAVTLVRIEGPVASDYVHTRHVHPYWQMELVMDRRLRIRVGKRILRPRDGDLVLIPPQNWHHLEHPEGKAGRSIKFAVEEMSEHYPAGIVARTAAAELIHGALRAAILLGNEPDEQTRVHIEHLLAAALDIHFGHLQPGGAEADLVRKARQHVDQALAAGRPLFVNELASTLRCSTAYLNRVFRNRLGISAKSFIDQQRFEVACRLLLGTSLNVSQLAEELGFDDAFRFSRFFKRLSGVAPSDYRRAAPDAAAQ